MELWIQRVPSRVLGWLLGRFKVTLGTNLNDYLGTNSGRFGELLYQDFAGLSDYVYRFHA